MWHNYSEVASNMEKSFSCPSGMLCPPPRTWDLIFPTAGISPGNTITHLKYLTQGLSSASNSTACWWAIRNKHCYVTFKTWRTSCKINDSFNGFRYTGPSPASALRSYLWPGLNWVSLCVSFEKPLQSKPFTGFIIRMLWKFLCREQKQSNYYVCCMNAKKKST